MITITIKVLSNYVVRCHCVTVWETVAPPNLIYLCVCSAYMAYISVTLGLILIKLVGNGGT